MSKEVPVIDSRCPSCEVRIVSLLRREVDHFCYRTYRVYTFTKDGVYEKEN